MLGRLFAKRSKGDDYDFRDSYTLADRTSGGVFSFYNPSLKRSEVDYGNREELIDHLWLDNNRGVSDSLTEELMKFRPNMDRDLVAKTVDARLVDLGRSGFDPTREITHQEMVEKMLDYGGGLEGLNNYVGLKVAEATADVGNVKTSFQRIPCEPTNQDPLIRGKVAEDLDLQLDAKGFAIYEDGEITPGGKWNHRNHHQDEEANRRKTNTRMGVDNGLYMRSPEALRYHEMEKSGVFSEVEWPDYDWSYADGKYGHPCGQDYNRKSKPHGDDHFRVGPEGLDFPVPHLPDVDAPVPAPTGPKGHFPAAPGSDLGFGSSTPGNPFGDMGVSGEGLKSGRLRRSDDGIDGMVAEGGLFEQFSESEGEGAENSGVDFER